MKLILFCICMGVVFAACAQKPTKPSRASRVLREERKNIEKLEKDKADLELRNSILVNALSQRKKTVLRTKAGGQVVQQFPDFEELIYDQAKTAYAEKDETRLSEAVRILKSNQPSSRYLEGMYFWLGKTQQEKGQRTQALITYSDFIKSFPNSQYVPQALYLKGQIYEKINLKPQAFKIYSDLRKQFPHSREKHFADSRLESFKADKAQKDRQ